MRVLAILLFTIGCVAVAAQDTPVPIKPVPIKVVVVTFFERGSDEGDAPGEFQFWVERNHLNRVIPFPQGNHDLRINDQGVLGILAGVGTARAAASIAALATDPRFDLSKAYWLVAGIAGVDPRDASLGSAAWAEWIVDGDLAYEIDSREIPRDWKTGFVPLRKTAPYEQPHAPDSGETYRLNPSLVDWAYHLTQKIKLADSAAMQQARAHYQQKNAGRPPFVLKGDDISASTFWTGALLSEWANDWVKYHTGDQGNYVMTAMEDSGVMQSLTFASKAGRADLSRVLVLRTASNFDQPGPGMTAAEKLKRDASSGYAGLVPALESAWLVGNTVVSELVANWSRYRDRVPGTMK